MQYARLISETAGLPLYNVKDSDTDPSTFDFLILGGPIIYYKLSIHKWVKRHLEILDSKPLIFFSVSGAPAGAKLDGWIADSLPEDFISRMNHVALRGRQIPAQLSWYDRMMLIIGGLTNKDPEAGKQELEGFDFMDKSSIEPILKLAQQFQLSETLS